MPSLEEFKQEPDRQERARQQRYLNSAYNGYVGEGAHSNVPIHLSALLVLSALGVFVLRLKIMVLVFLMAKAAALAAAAVVVVATSAVEELSLLRFTEIEFVKFYEDPREQGEYFQAGRYKKIVGHGHDQGRQRRVLADVVVSAPDPMVLLVTEELQAQMAERPHAHHHPPPNSCSKQCTSYFQSTGE